MHIWWDKSFALDKCDSPDTCYSYNGLTGEEAVKYGYWLNKVDHSFRNVLIQKMQAVKIMIALIPLIQHYKFYVI